MAGHWAQKDIETLASKLIINGMADRTFAPDVNTAAKLGLVQGVGEGKFSPDTVITREQMIVMIMNAVQLVQGDLCTEAQFRTPFADQASISDYASNAVTEAAEKGLIKGKTETTFAPQDVATRAEAAVMIKQILQYLKLMN